MEASARPHRWFVPAPAWLIYGAAAGTGVLFTSECWRWFFFNEHKGWTVLIAVALVGVVFLLLLAWMLLALLFRRRFQFGLRTLLVFVTLCALACSWMAVRLHEARRQAAAVAAIQGKLHGSVYFDFEFDDSDNLQISALPPESDILREELGVDFFADVKEIWLHSREVTDEGLADIAALTRLKRLVLYDARATDSVLSHLTDLAKKLQQVLPRSEIEVDTGPDTHLLMPFRESQP